MGRWSLCVHWQGDDLVHCAGGVRSRIQDEGYIKSRESKPESDHSIHVTGVKKCSSRKLVGEWWKEVWGGGLVHGSSPDLQGSRADETSFHLADGSHHASYFAEIHLGVGNHPENIGKHLQTMERGLAPPWWGFSVLTHLEFKVFSSPWLFPSKWRLLWVFTSWAHLTMAPCHPTAFLPGSCRCVAPRKVVLQWKQSSRISAWRLPSLAQAGVCDGFLCSPG